ncbi:unnamed protein product, partial [Mesorhabditis spiculigera]
MQPFPTAINRASARSGDVKTVLSVFWTGSPRHFIINKAQGRGPTVEKHRFPSVGDLVRFHRTRQIPVTEGKVFFCLLMNPVERSSSRLHKGKQMTKNLIKEICKEARIMRRYEHKNIVQKFFGVAIATLVDGGTLDSYLTKNGTDIFLQDKALHAASTAGGLEYLHEQAAFTGMSLAPNCPRYLRRARQNLEFGLSPLDERRQARYKLKDLHQRLPIRWLAPETLRERTTTTKTDVYSFGGADVGVVQNRAIPYPGMTVQEVREGTTARADMMPIIARDVMRKKCFPEKPEGDRRWVRWVENHILISR